jgi:hypothetical protein
MLDQYLRIEALAHQFYVDQYIAVPTVLLRGATSKML